MVIYVQLEGIPIRMLLLDIAANTLSTLGEFRGYNLGWSHGGRYLLALQGPDVTVHDFNAAGLQSAAMTFDGLYASWLPGQHRAVLVNLTSPLNGSAMLADIRTGEQTPLTGNVSDLLYVGP